MQARSGRWLLVAMAAVCFAAAPRAQAQLPTSLDSPARLVLRTSGEPALGAAPHYLTAVGNLVYYAANDEARGSEIWRSDGTPQGTFPLRSNQPRPTSTDISALFPAATRVFYAWLNYPPALFQPLDVGLGVSDGTLQGTVAFSSGQPRKALAIGDTLYFGGDRPLGSSGLWKSAGTAQGTLLLKAMDVRGLLDFGGTIYVSGDDGKGSSGIWRSNGTPQGTLLVKAMRPDALASASAILGGRFYFAGDSGGSDQELWASDGTSTGSVLVKDIRPGPLCSSLQNLVALGGRLYFSADDGVHGSELWVSDGTPQGTRMVSDLAPGSPSSTPYAIKPFGDAVAFTTQVSGSVSVWRSDGTPQGTLLLATGQKTGFAPYDVGLTTVGSALYFQTQAQTAAGVQSILWKSDGTPQGTTALLSFDTRTKRIGDLFSLGDALAFSVVGEGSSALWRSDGTAQGTALVKRFSGIKAGNAIVRGGKLFFSADDGTRGDELWVSDGTAAGTLILSDLKGARVSSYPSQPAALGTTALFGFSQDASGNELWASDGSPQGTALLKDIRPGAESARPRELTQVGDKIYFSADDGSNGREPWLSDGTAAGTRLLKDLNPGPDDSSPQSFGAIGNKLYFSAATVLSDGLHAGLWISDGSEAGTTLLKAAGSGQSFLRLASAGGRLFFTIGAYSSSLPGGYQSELWASDGTTASTVSLGNHLLGTAVTGQAGQAFLSLADRTTGTALWASDGTAAGTSLVKTALPAQSDPFSLPTTEIGLTALGGTLFFRASDTATGIELWKSDGTPQGTALVKDIRPGRASGTSDNVALTPAGDQLFFAANDGVHGFELWRSDGSADGTVMIKDINPSPSSSSDIARPTVLGDTLLFINRDDAHGYELWASDGSTAGTQLVQDLNPGEASGLATLETYWSGRIYLTRWVYNDLWPAGGKLFFSGDDGQGRALWQIPGGVNAQVALASVGVRPGGTIALPIRYANAELGTTAMTLTVTLGGGLVYRGDSSGIAPTLVTSNTISWRLPRVGIGARGFSLLLQAPPAATLGDRLPVTLNLEAPGDADLSDNTASRMVLVARQTSLSLIGR